MPISLDKHNLGSYISPSGCTFSLIRTTKGGEEKGTSDTAFHLSHRFTKPSAFSVAWPEPASVPRREDTANAESGTSRVKVSVEVPDVGTFNSVSINAVESCLTMPVDNPS